MSYKYYINQKDGKYYFGLYPNNNNRESIGISGLYNSEKAAQEAINRFRSLIKDASNVYNLFETVCETNVIPKYKFVLKENQYNIVFQREKLYEHKYEVKKGIGRITKNIDAPIKTK